MSTKPIGGLRCPICRKPVRRAELEFPFCSERCRLIDLGKWAGGEYVVAGSLHPGADAGSLPAGPHDPAGDSA